MNSIFTTLVVILCQSPTPLDAKIIESLREIHDRGAKLYNDEKAYEECFRLYEGAIRAISPLLDHRPGVQKMIDAQWKAIDPKSTAKSRAFQLHELIETIRTQLKDEKKSIMKETAPDPQPRTPFPSPVPVPLKNVPTPTVPSAKTLTVMLNGKSLTAGTVQLVSLDQKSPTITTLELNSMGEATLSTTLKPGRYVVTVSGDHVPKRYETTNESGLTVDVVSSNLVLNLKN